MEFVESEGKLVELGTGRHVFRQGDDDRHLYFLQRGLLKAYYLSDDGRETIKSFIQEGEMIGSLASAHRRQNCSFNLVSLEPSILVQLEFDALYEAGRKDLQIAAATVDALLGLALKKEQREREFLTESAEARYRMLLERSPELMDRVKQKDIARYLGITPVALSRIRARQ